MRNSHSLSLLPRGIILLLLASFAPASLASLQSSEESAGQSAEQAGKLREAVTHYTAALKSAPEGSDQDQRRREKIIKLVLQLNPPPAVPDEVISYEGRAEAAVKSAAKQDDFMDAAKEYRKALRAAPWVASYYFNLAVVLEKAGQPAEAIRQFKLYLIAAPAAQDATDVKKKIGGIEYQIEKTAQASAEAARARQVEEEKARQEQQRYVGIDALQGEWSTGIWTGDSWLNTGGARIVRSGNILEIRFRYPGKDDGQWLRGEITGSDLKSVQFKKYFDPPSVMCSNNITGWYPVEVGETAPGREIRIKDRQIHTATAESRICDIDYIQWTRLTR